MKIAVVGSGISGLVAAEGLSRGHDVTLFEADTRLGGHTHTVDVEVQGQRFAVDTGFIVFNHRTYPNFTRLLDRLGVKSKASSMSFSVHADESGLEYGGTDLGTLFAQRRNLFRPRFHRMLLEILRFNREAPRILDAEDHTEVTVAEYVASKGYSRTFLDHYLLPLGSSIWSCSHAQLEAFPLRFFVTFLHNHGMLELRDRPQWRVVEGGSRSYIEPLTRSFAERVRLGMPVRSIARDTTGVELGFASGERERFDHVVLACHSDQALRCLADPSPLEREILGDIAYQGSEVVLHTDTALLPKRRSIWSAWNHRFSAEDPARVCVTYDMNILQGLDAPETFCVTLNPRDRIDPAKVLRRFDYHHPLYSVPAEKARQRHQELIAHRNTSYCGAYWGYGFHEDGVKSALAVLDVLKPEAVAAR